jgi:hypothetical protein
LWHWLISKFWDLILIRLWYWSDNLCKLFTDQWRGSLGIRNSESCWFTEEIGTYMRCWKSPGDLPLPKKFSMYRLCIKSSIEVLKYNRILHTFLGKTGWSPMSDRTFMSFREWSAAQRAKRNKNLRKAQISVESYLVYQSVSQKSILCDVYFITLNDIDNIINIKSHENREQVLRGSYIRSWERPGDLPWVIELLCLFTSGAQRNERKETKISFTSGRSPIWGVSWRKILYSQ